MRKVCTAVLQWNPQGRWAKFIFMKDQSTSALMYVSTEITIWATRTQDDSNMKSLCNLTCNYAFLLRWTKKNKTKKKRTQHVTLAPDLHTMRLRCVSALFCQWSWWDSILVSLCYSGCVCGTSQVRHGSGDQDVAGRDRAQKQMKASGLFENKHLVGLLIQFHRYVNNNSDIHHLQKWSPATKTC